MRSIVAMREKRGFVMSILTQKHESSKNNSQVAKKYHNWKILSEKSFIKEFLKYRIVEFFRQKLQGDWFTKYLLVNCLLSKSSKIGYLCAVQNSLIENWIILFFTFAKMILITYLESAAKLLSFCIWREALEFAINFFFLVFLSVLR